MVSAPPPSGRCGDSCRLCAWTPVAVQVGSDDPGRAGGGSTTHPQATLVMKPNLSAKTCEQAMQRQPETLDEVIERCALASEMGAVTQLLVQGRHQMSNEIRPDRLSVVRGQIRSLKAAEHPVVRLVHPEGPHEHKVAYRPWADVPEPAKLSMLLDLVSWEGVSNKLMATLLLGEVDVGKLTTGQRDMLIRLAEPEPVAGKSSLSLDELKQATGRRPAGQNNAKQRENGME